MAYKTPGVYVEEITTFPPSVVAIETAIPAFIGYTEKAQDAAGGSLSFVPTRVKSLLDFEAVFGGEFKPAIYEVVVATADKNPVDDVSPKDAANEIRRYYLYNSVRHFYANGGGPCYIVSVGRYTDAPAKPGLLAGLSRIERVDEPTLVLLPDGVALSASDLGSLQVAALEQCEKLQDRFVIMDLCGGYMAASVAGDPVADFRQQIGMNNLKYGAAYYPWVRTTYRPTLHARDLRLFKLVNKIAVLISDSDLDSLTGVGAIDALVPATRAADANAATVVTSVNISGMAGTPLTLNRNNFGDLTSHFAHLLDLLRQTSPEAEAEVRQRFANLLLLPRAIALAFHALETATLPVPLTQALTNLSTDTTLAAAIVKLIAWEKNADLMGCVSTTRALTDVETDYAALNSGPWIALEATRYANVAEIEINATRLTPLAAPLTDANLRETALNAAAAVQEPFEKLAAAILAVFSSAEFFAAQAEKQLFDKHSIYRDVAEQVARTMTLLPASGAVAGAYAAVDRSRGVWKAPANVSLADVVGPSVKINDQAQADLNVTTTGKSVNAIRAFTGKGTLIWGARTLAGNDNEWRYVPVRRFFNMAEESIKKATEPFVFEPNDANTWVRVRAMIENFLTIQWRQGALAGATPVQAFYVKVGLGETMTAQDILEGRMIVEIGMAVVRPAEFIVLRFAHKMQVS